MRSRSWIAYLLLAASGGFPLAILRTAQSPVASFGADGGREQNAGGESLTFSPDRFPYDENTVNHYTFIVGDENTPVQVISVDTADRFTITPPLPNQSKEAELGTVVKVPGTIRPANPEPLAFAPPEVTGAARLDTAPNDFQVGNLFFPMGTPPPEGWPIVVANDSDGFASTGLPTLLSGGYGIRSPTNPGADGFESLLHDMVNAGLAVFWHGVAGSTATDQFFYPPGHVSGNYEDWNYVMPEKSAVYALQYVKAVLPATYPNIDTERVFVQGEGSGAHLMAWAAMGRSRELDWSAPYSAQSSSDTHVLAAVLLHQSSSYPAHDQVGAAPYQHFESQSSPGNAATSFDDVDPAILMAASGAAIYTQADARASSVHYFSAYAQAIGSTDFSVDGANFPTLTSQLAAAEDLWHGAMNDIVLESIGNPATRGFAVGNGFQADLGPAAGRETFLWNGSLRTPVFRQELIDWMVARADEALVPDGEGLRLDPLTGILHGRPNLAAASTAYTVVAETPLGVEQGAIKIIVRKPLIDPGATRSKLGINFQPNDNTNRDVVFADAMKRASFWNDGVDTTSLFPLIDYGSLGETYPDPAMRGTPTCPLFGGNMAANYSSGQFDIEWDGTGTVVLSGPAVTSTLSSGPNEASFDIDSTKAALNCQITANDELDPVRNIRVWLPGMKHSGNVFYPPWLETFEDYQDSVNIWRNTNWMGWINAGRGPSSEGSPDDRGYDLDFAERTLPTQHSQGLWRGTAIEYFALFSNATKTSPHLVIHPPGNELTDAEWVIYLQQYVGVLLDGATHDGFEYPGLSPAVPEVIFELGNELWNSQFAFSAWINSEAVRRGIGTEQLIGVLFELMQQTINAEFAARGDTRARYYIGGTNSDMSFLTRTLNNLTAAAHVDYAGAQSYIALSDAVTGTCPGGYIEEVPPGSGMLPNLPTVESYLEDLSNELHGRWLGQMTSNKDLVEGFVNPDGTHPRLYSYEGGPNCVPTGPDERNDGVDEGWFLVAVQAQTHPDMYQLIRDWLTLHSRLEADAMFFSHIGEFLQPSDNGSWGTRSNYFRDFDLTSPRSNQDPYDNVDGLPKVTAIVQGMPEFTLPGVIGPPLPIEGGLGSGVVETDG